MLGALYSVEYPQIPKFKLEKMTQKAPTCFISHGAPSFAIEQDELSDYLYDLGQSLKNVKAILIVSPHWQTQQLEVMTTAKPTTIHDFYGFPEALYSLQYPASGNPSLARQVIELLAQHKIDATENSSQGYDHGAWVPLIHLLPKHQLPVFQISLPTNFNPKMTFDLGKAIASLRDEGVMIIGSGGLTHNLYELQPKESKPEHYIEEFVNWMDDKVKSRDFEQLVNYRTLAPHSKRAHPTDEHLLPLFIALGASDDNEELTIVENQIYYGILSTKSYFWGV